MVSGTLVLVRHGQSDWNAKNLFTGWTDVGLTERGRQEAARAGKLLQSEGLTFDMTFTSELERAQDTQNIILDQMGQAGIPETQSQALNERDYGDLAGLNKDEAREKFGADQVHIWRRSYDIPPPGGESLKDTAQRTLPYFEATVLPNAIAGKTVLVAAHGNSLRAIVMKLDGLSPEEIVAVEIATGVPIIYTIESDGSVASKRVLESAG